MPSLGSRVFRRNITRDEVTDLAYEKLPDEEQVLLAVSVRTTLRKIRWLAHAVFIDRR
jgi:hypothetical protein